MFAPDGDGLRYSEQGVLTLGGYRDTVSRCYCYEFPDKHRAFVRFADGRPFHDLDFRSKVARAHHRCGDDTYRATVSALDDRAWQVCWRVIGPRKDQTITSRYTRLPDQS